MSRLHLQQQLRPYICRCKSQYTYIQHVYENIFAAADNATATYEPRVFITFAAAADATAVCLYAAASESRIYDAFAAACAAASYVACTAADAAAANAAATAIADWESQVYVAFAATCAAATDEPRVHVACAGAVCCSVFCCVVVGYKGCNVLQ